MPGRLENGDPENENGYTSHARQNFLGYARPVTAVRVDRELEWETVFAARLFPGAEPPKESQPAQSGQSQGGWFRNRLND